MKDNLGILLPVASLPGQANLGDFGPSAYEFIDFLKSHNFKYWQILPLNPLGPGNSPYMSSCSFAIDPIYISLDLLFEDKLIKKVIEIESTNKIDYVKGRKIKEKYLLEAYKNFDINDHEFVLFQKDNSWAYKYGIYQLLLKKNHGKHWNDWKEKDIHFLEKPYSLSKSENNEIIYYVFLQFIAFKQWNALLSYARENGINIIADMPFYVGLDSMECWSNKEEFVLDSQYKPSLVAGVPPDYFSKTGQLWGNPIYDFKKMKENNYSFLMSRISYLAQSCDYLRIDHFRAFDTYFVIPAKDKDALNGHWEEGIGKEFFKLIFDKYPDINLIAEDLGDMFPSVYELRDEYHLPGMFVSQFAILNYDFWPNENMIVYTGTHDNEMFIDWFNSLKESDYQILRDRFQYFDDDLYSGVFNGIINLPSKMTIIPMGDYLKLDNKSRINTPGTENKDNWTWKLKDNSYKK